MAVYVLQAMVVWDGDDQSDQWAEGNAQAAVDYLRALTGQALVVPGTAGERSSYAIKSEMGPDGSLSVLSAWHVNDVGQVVDGLPDGSGAPPAADEWAAGVTYAVDDVVTYQGVTYRCISGHTSLVGWEPPNVPALWTAV